jgi:cell division septation protein DedD
VVEMADVLKIVNTLRVVEIGFGYGAFVEIVEDEDGDYSAVIRVPFIAKESAESFANRLLSEENLKILESLKV